MANTTTKVYNVILVILESLLVILKIFYYIGEGIYRFLVPVEEKSVVGEIVLITGTGHGIGKELATCYASLGATVVCWDINKETNEETVNEIKKTGATAVYAYQCDVSKIEEILEVAARVKKEIGDVTILVNNAGIVAVRPLLHHAPETIRQIIDVNILAHFWMIEAFLPKMIERNHGHIVGISSLLGVIGFPTVVPYCATKFAIRGLMEALSEELRRTSNGKSLIKLTTIYPNFVDTGFGKKPEIRFEYFMPIVSPQQAASQIITAQRREYRNRSVPAIWYPLIQLLRYLPEKALMEIIDFVDVHSNVDLHD